MTNLKFMLAVSTICTGASLQALANGATYGVTYSFQAQGNTSDGANSEGRMIYEKGKLYGTTENGGSGGQGTVFSVDPSTGIEKVLYSFQGGSDGYTPARGLAFDEGNLYGTTVYGGESEGEFGVTPGTIFSVDRKTGKKQTLFKFPNDYSLGYAPGDLVFQNGLIYGTTALGGLSNGESGFGTLFSFDPNTKVLTILHTWLEGKDDTYDGGTPLAGLLYHDGALYGSTQVGGGEGLGSVFKYDTTTGSFTTLAGLSNTNKTILHGPKFPQSTPVRVNHDLYFTSEQGGNGTGNGYDGWGTVFRLNLLTNHVKVVYDFQNGSDGSFPLAGLIYRNGLLYGTTGQGGAHSGGVLFSIDPKTGAEANLHSFGVSSDGVEPAAALTLVGGALFGTTYSGGTEGEAGTIFNFTP